MYCKGDRFAWLLEELRFKQLDTTKTIVFCRSIARCALMYQTLDLGLKEDGYVPRGKFGIACALFAMYHAKITDNEKKLVLESFSVAGGNCRLLFCTVAFGMGINIPNVYRVIHDGPPSSIEQYVQETGRGGRDGQRWEAVLYTFSGSTKGKISKNMKEYCSNNNRCRQDQLLRCFLQVSGGHAELRL